MFQTIGEKVIVAGVYKRASFIPRKFLWNTTTYPINQITLVSDIKDGHTKQRMYSVMSGTTLFRLVFNRDTEVWTLEEMWVE